MAHDFHFNVMMGIERGDRKWEQGTLHIQTALFISSASALEKGGHAFSGGPKVHGQKSQSLDNVSSGVKIFRKGHVCLKVHMNPSLEVVRSG